MKYVRPDQLPVRVIRSTGFWKIFNDDGDMATVEFFEDSEWFAKRIGECFNACAGIDKPGEAIPKLVEAAKGLMSRKIEGPVENAHLFAEWDDLEDALEMVGGG